MISGPRPPLIPQGGRRLLGQVLLCTAALLIVLEAWRPYYFLTDDNLSAGLPFLTEMGRHLKSGQSPFYSDYLFGGHYNLLRDATYFSWHPVDFAVSLLADTPGRFAMLDIVGWMNMLLAAAGFAVLGATAREELGLKVSDGRLLFLTLSFTFSTFVLTTGASWANFLSNQAALPWLALGLWQTRWRRSLLFLVVFSVHQALGGQPAGTISNGLVLTLFALLLCAYRRCARPLAMWIAANVIALIVILPLLLPAMGGFFHSTRGAGISVELLSRFAMPAPLVLFSLLLGNFAEMATYFAHVRADTTAFLYFPRLPTLLACGAAWCIFLAVFQRRRWTELELGCVALMALLLVFIVRPIAITDFMSHLPVLRSMRWPFREILQFLFFFHLLLVLRPWGGKPEMQNRIACFSLVLFVLPLFFTAPLTLNPLVQDRETLFSGRADRLWADVKSRLRPGDEIATVIDSNTWFNSFDKPSYVMSGTADFPAYFQIRSISGYSQTAPIDQLPVPVKPSFWFGAYDTSQIEEITHGHPEVRVIRVTQFQPLRMTLSMPVGPPVELQTEANVP